MMKQGRPRAVNCLQHTDNDVTTGILDACVEARRGEGLAKRPCRIQINAGGQRGIAPFENVPGYA
eukprot:1400531-Lingulodinium_polyedra.AAC.1